MLAPKQKEALKSLGGGNKVTPEIERSIYDGYSAKIGGLLNGYARAIVREYSDNPERGGKSLRLRLTP